MAGLCEVLTVRGYVTITQDICSVQQNKTKVFHLNALIVQRQLAIKRCLDCKKIHVTFKSRGGEKG